jgi:hypothetical protein
MDPNKSMTRVLNSSLFLKTLTLHEHPFLCENQFDMGRGIVGATDLGLLELFFFVVFIN